MYGPSDPGHRKAGVAITFIVVSALVLAASVRGDLFPANRGTGTTQAGATSQRTVTTVTTTTVTPTTSASSSATSSTTSAPSTSTTSQASTSTSSPSTTSAATSTITSTYTATVSSTTTVVLPKMSVLTVASRWVNGTPIPGLYAVLTQNGAAVAEGFTPAKFNLADGQEYQVAVQGNGVAYFQYWEDTGWVNAVRNVTVQSSETVMSVFCDGACSDASTAPAPSNGITVYANRIPASYWASCFAAVCSAGTGPGATMYFVLEDSTGSVVQSGFANEWGFTFGSLTPGVTYYLLAENCNLCHGSTHDVVFNYWTGGTLGSSQVATNPIPVSTGDVVEGWFSCTNGCA